MKRWGLLGTFVLVLSVALWNSWLVSQEREVTLRYKFPVKETRTYSIRLTGEMAMTVQILGQEAPATISLQGTMTQTERVEDVDKEGVATIVATTKGRMKTEVTGLPVGAEFPQQQEVPEVIVRLKVDPLGKVKEVKVEKIDEQPKTKMRCLSVRTSQCRKCKAWDGKDFLLPEKPVRPGDSWDITTEQTVNFGDKTVKLEIKGKLKGENVPSLRQPLKSLTSASSSRQFRSRREKAASMQELKGKAAVKSGLTSPTAWS